MGGGGAMEFLRYEEPVRGSRGEGLGAGDPVGSSSSARDGGASEDAEPDPDGDAPRDSEREGGGAATRAAPRTRPYTIAKGDTISTIAARELGSTRYVKAIEALNPRVVATRLIPGQVLLLPEAEDADTDGTPVARDVKIQVVDLKKGETLVSLAQKHLGDGNRWREILKLNENHISSTNLSSLPVGMRVRVPAGR